MNTIIVPTDFSDTASNAAQYAYQFAQQVNAQKILLVHSYELPIALDPLMPGIQIPALEGLKEGAEHRLEKFKMELLAKFPDGKLSVDTIADFGSIVSLLETIAEKEPIELIVMGITGGGALEEVFIGSNTLKVASELKVPLIIVPPRAVFKGISKLMLTCDFDEAEQYLPIELLKKIQAITHAKLHVFNIEGYTDEYAVKFPSNIMGEAFAVHTLLQELNPEYHYAHKDDYVEAVNDFADINGMNLIITVPKKHNFFEKLFSSSHTKQLAFHSHIPLLVANKN